MSIQLKNGPEDNLQDGLQSDSLDNVQANPVDGFDDGFDPKDPESKYRGGLGDGTVDIDKINDLPAYTAPPLMNEGGIGAASGAEKRSLIYKIIGIVLLLVVVFFIYRGVNYLTGTGGKDITAELTKSEDEIAKDLRIKFEDNDARLKSIPHYAKGTVKVRSGKELHVVYLDDEQTGINSNSRKYRFFGVGINDPEKTAVNNMTYQYEDCMVLANDLIGGNSDTYFYYNTKNNDAFVLAINKNSARVVNMTYFTDCKKMLAGLN